MNEENRAIDSVWVQREGDKAIRLIERLMSHQTFLEQARKTKARRGASLALEHEVILQAGDAERDARDFSVIALRLTAQFDNAGVFDEARERWTQRLDTEGQTVKDFWAKADADLQLLQKLQQPAGLADSTIQWLGNQIDEVDFVLGVNNSGELTVRSEELKGEITITAPAKLGQAKSIGDLLFARRLQATIAALYEPGKVVTPAVLVPTEDGKYRATIIDVIVDGIIANLHEFARQRRQLEDVGLPTIQGSLIDPATLLTAAAIFFAAGFIVGIACIITQVDIVCIASAVLLVISAALFAFGQFAATAQAGAALTTAETSALWELRAGDIPAYQSVVRGGF